MQSKSPTNGAGTAPGFFTRHNVIVYLAFVLTVVLFSIILGGKFLALNNVLNITRQTAMISIMAVGMTFVIGAAQIDLSIGSIMGSLLMGVINNGLVLGGLSVAQQSIVRGAIIIIATAIGSRSNSKTS